MLLLFASSYDLRTKVKWVNFTIENNEEKREEAFFTTKNREQSPVRQRFRNIFVYNMHAYMKIAA